MNKSNHFFGQPIFSQLLSLIDRSLIKRIVAKHQADRYYKRLDTWQHLVSMLYGCISGATALERAHYRLIGLPAQAGTCWRIKGCQAIYTLGRE